MFVTISELNATVTAEADGITWPLNVSTTRELFLRPLLRALGFADPQIDVNFGFGQPNFESVQSEI